MIEWNFHGKKLKTIRGKQHKAVIQQIYGWLSMGRRLHQHDPSEDHICPLSKKIQEDNLHMFHCQHKMMETQQNAVVSIL